MTKISCGWNHTGCVTSEGLCFTWGQATFGQLGSGNIQNPSYEQGNTGVFPNRVGFFEKNFINITDISCGGKHTLFLSSKLN